MPSTLKTLARADSFSSFNLSRRSAQWQIQELPQTPGPLDALFTARSDTPVTLPQTTWQRDMFDDYATTGLSLRAHPVQCVRTILESKGAKTTTDLLSKNGIPVGTRVTTGGLAITRQRPGTAKGVVFITLEDEWGSLNLIIRPALFERYSTIVMSASLLCVKGSLQRIGEVIYIEVDDITSLDTFLRHTSTNPYFSRSSLRSP
jgi:error-prone DNA polymerase